MSFVCLASFGCHAGAQARPAEVQVAEGSAAERPVEAVPPAPPVRTIVRGLLGLEVGMTVKELATRMGPPTRVASREEERAQWEDAGYATSRSVIFTTGFDEVHVYTPGAVPLFKAYVDRDIVVALKFVLYGAEAHLEKQSVGFGEGCVLGGPSESVFRAFGEPDVRSFERGMSTLQKLQYFERGISITIEEGKIVVFDIYAPPSATTKRSLIDVIRTERREL